MVLLPGLAPGPRPSHGRVMAFSPQEEIGARRRSRTGLVRLTRPARRYLRLTGIGRRDRIRTCTGLRPRVSETRVYAFHHPPKNWCGRRESHPHELAPTGISGRRVCCSATSAENGSGTETCAPLFPIPTGCVASYALPAWSRRKDLHLRSPRGLRVYSAPHLLLCHVSKLGARAGVAPAWTRRMKPSHCCYATEPKWWAVSVMLRVLPVKSRLLHG